ncbi:MAG: hypothetical protein ACLPIX_03110, partial [Rhodomicrobium sp.]
MSETGETQAAPVCGPVASGQPALALELADGSHHPYSAKPASRIRPSYFATSPALPICRQMS